MAELNETDDAAANKSEKSVELPNPMDVDHKDAPTEKTSETAANKTDNSVKNTTDKQPAVDVGAQQVQDAAEMKPVTDNDQAVDCDKSASYRKTEQRDEPKPSSRSKSTSASKKLVKNATTTSKATVKKTPKTEDAAPKKATTATKAKANKTPQTEDIAPKKAASSDTDGSNKTKPVLKKRPDNATNASKADNVPTKESSEPKSTDDEAPVGRKGVAISDSLSAKQKQDIQNRLAERAAADKRNADRMAKRVAEKAAEKAADEKAAAEKASSKPIVTPGENKAKVTPAASKPIVTPGEDKAKITPAASESDSDGSNGDLNSTSSDSKASLTLSPEGQEDVDSADAAVDRWAKARTQHHTALLQTSVNGSRPPISLTARPLPTYPVDSKRKRTANDPGSNSAKKPAVEGRTLASPKVCILHFPLFFRRMS
jgi:hypothetical protein